MTHDLIGKRFRSKIADYEEDEDYGEVTHPIGSEFVVDKALGYMLFEPGDERHGEAYAVLWQGTALPGHWASDSPEVSDFIVTGDPVPAEGMWTIWTRAEILRDAEAV